MRFSSRAAEERPRSSSQTTVSVNYDESADAASHSQLNFEVAECIETKTITTTTTTKRCYPPLLVKEQRSLSRLNPRDFPLALKPTPPELARFSFDIDTSSGVPGWPGNSEYSHGDEHDDQTYLGADGEFSHDPIHGESMGNADATPDRTRPRISRHMGRDVMGSRANRQSATSGKAILDVSPSKVPSSSSATSDRFRRALVHGSPKDAEGVEDDRANTDVPTTPSATDYPRNMQPLRSLRNRRSHLEFAETSVHDSQRYAQQPPYNAGSPAGSDSHTVFSNVATPPITDADAEPFADIDADESLQQSIRALQPPRAINTVAAQDVSLPSPRLSPTLQAAQLHDDDDEVMADGNDDSMLRAESHMLTDEDRSSFSNTVARSMMHSRHQDASDLHLQSSFLDSKSMLQSFDAMPAEMKSFMMYQFLRRCSRKTLHAVATVVNPALNRDVLKDLPTELTLHILSYLDHRDLCRAAQVSKHWRSIIDSNETGWKDLFDLDGFTISSAELERAIHEGWGWQDPFGPEGCERDYSLQSRLHSSELDLLRMLPGPSSSARSDFPHSRLRSKRKRALHPATFERSKRQAIIHDNAATSLIKEKTCEGPISAANAAAMAVPDPQLGIPSLRRMHLYKSLYRRHFMTRKSWTSGKVKPGHVAFTAHPRHVITCLQFDEDKIITGSDDMFIHVYDTKTGKLRKRLEGHEGGVWALQYEGNTLVSGSTDRSVRVWDIEKGMCTQIFYGHTSTVRCLQILMPTDTGKVENGVPVMMPPKPLIITGSRDSQLRVWRLPEASSRRYIQTGPPANDADCPYFIRTLQGHTHSVRAIAAHADTLVSGSYDNTVRVWRISTGETVHVLQGHTQKVYSVVLDLARNRCISGSMDSFVKIWDLETGSCTHTLEGHSLLVGLLDLRDERLVSAAADSTLRIWDPESGRCQSTLTAHTGAITCFQHDGRKVISGSDRTLKMWDVRTGECIQDLLTDLGGVWQVRFDERRCVAAVQRDGITFIEILDFGAVRDGKSPEELGKRILLNPQEVQRIIDEDNATNTNN
ncbi:F-box and WD-40 domain protein CDC4 [Microdochium nivale]|nr:F-box and WD-40 domain protein CDC4 [Microdochium nivale]